MAELTHGDVEILDFERSWWKRAAVKDTAIRECFGMSPARYYQLLNELLDRPEAGAYDVILVKRLQRLRTYRQRQRVTHRLGAWKHTPATR